MKQGEVILDDDGNPITSPAILAMIERRRKISNDLRFPFLSNKISGGREPTKTQWLEKYYVYLSLIHISEPTRPY